MVVPILLQKSVVAVIEKSSLWCESAAELSMMGRVLQQNRHKADVDVTERQSSRVHRQYWWPLLTKCMVRPCLARGFVDLGVGVLHQCIRHPMKLFRAIMESGRVRSH
jgi:hypothetical protein